MQLIINAIVFHSTVNCMMIVVTANAVTDSLFVQLLVLALLNQFAVLVAMIFVATASLSTNHGFGAETPGNADKSMLIVLIMMMDVATVFVQSD